MVIGAGLALLVGLTAGPLAAASSTKKTYSATVDPATLPYSAPSITHEFKVTYTNTTPGGTSTINSVVLTAPTGYVINTTPAPTFTTSPASTAGALTTTSTSITLTNLNPLTYTQSVTLDFWATVDTTSLTCSTAAGAWATQAWTGSNTSGTLFSLSSPKPTTTIGTAVAAGGQTSYVDANGNTVTVTNVGTTCTPLTISRSGNSTTIAKPTTAGVALMADIVWDPEPAVQPLPVTQVDTPSPTHDIQWCDGTSSAPGLPAGTSEVSCLVSESSQIAGPDASGNQQVQVHDVVYLLGDWGAAR